MALTDYSAKVTDHFLNPRKLGALTAKDIQSPDERLLIGDAGQITRGDAMRITLRVRLPDELILDARFQNFGTGLPIAGASAFCTLIINKTLNNARRLTALDLDRDLDGLPELKLRKPVWVLAALDNAIRKFRGQSPREKNPPGDIIICTCFQVGASLIERAVRLRALKSVDEITDATQAGGGCHTCHPELEDILARCAQNKFNVHLTDEDYRSAQTQFGIAQPTADELAHNPPAPAKQAADGFIYPDKSPVAEAVAKKSATAQKPPSKPWREMTNTERMELIEHHLENNLRPAIRSDGGDIKLVGLEDCRVRVTLHGHCRSCHSAISTLKFGVEKHLRDHVWPELEVEEVVEGY